MTASDYEAWIEVRERCRDWLVPWEPRPADAPLPAEDRHSFAARCSLRERERQLGTGYGFGIFVDRQFVGELTLSSVQRGPFQSGFIGYWIDQAQAGKSYIPEAVAVTLAFAFDDLDLHRIEISIIPRNDRSLNVVRNSGSVLKASPNDFFKSMACGKTMPALVSPKKSGSFDVTNLWPTGLLADHFLNLSLLIQRPT